MAVYPSPSSWRMPYDKDGTIVIRHSTAASHLYEDQPLSRKEGLNSEVGSVWPLAFPRDSGGIVVWMFPNERDIDGVFWAFTNSLNGTISLTVEVSTDSTNGVDGVWTQVDNLPLAEVGERVVSPEYRTGVRWNSWLGVRAMRVKVTGFWASSVNLRAAHIYGEGIGNRRELCLWHPTLDQRLAPQYFDFGDVPRGTSADRTFRVKNLDASKTATSTRVALSALTDSTPSVASQHLLSTDGLTFMAQVNVGDIAPGGMSAPVTVRRVTPTNAPLGPWAPRIFAEPIGWV